MKEPLLHFLLIGAGLFWLYGWVNPGAPAIGEKTIVVSSGRIEQLLRIFEKTWQRPPTSQELKGLIDDYIIEELYYRQAVAMGIDKDDTLIRRRMRQKLEFLTDDTAALMKPDDAELESYLATNEKKFRRDPIYSFRQLYFNPQRHGDTPLIFAKQQLDKLRSGQTVEGDSTLIPDSFENESSRAIDGILGTGFSQQLESLALNQWSKPLRSGMGVHLVMLESSKVGVLPPLSEIRHLVVREWANDKRLEVRKRFNERLLEDYEVIIEWPEEEVAKDKK